MAQAGVSSLGVLLGYASESTKGVKPSAFNLLSRINSIGEIAVTPEKIDASALEDYESKFTDGRATTSDSVDVVVNMTDDTIAEWEDVIEEYEALTGGKEMWFTVWSPYLTKAFFFKGGVPSKLNMPSQDQNALETMTISIPMHSYEGMATAIKPVAKS